MASATSTADELLAAANDGDVACLERLAAEGVSLQVRNARGSTPLIVATIAQKCDAVLRLIELKANVNCTSNRGASALACAASLGNEQIAKALLQAGASVDAVDIAGESPLTRAIAKEHAGVVDILCSAGANVEHLDKRKFTPLMLVLSNASINLDIVKRLLLAGARADVTAEPWSTLHLCLKNNNVEAVKLLLEAGAPVDLNFPKARVTPLIGSTGMPTTDMARLLLEHGADVNFSSFGTTPLYAALVSPLGPSLDMVQLLIDHGADVNNRDAEGVSPLERTCSYGWPEVAKLLLDSGAAYMTLDKNRFTPLMRACQPGKPTLTPKDTDAKEAQKLQVVELLHEKGGINLEQANTNGATALTLAVANNYPSIVSYLLSKGVNSNPPDGQGSVPLGMAAHGGFTECVRLLLQYGGDPKIRDQAGRSPLWYGLQPKTAINADIVKMLLDAGADPNSGDIHTQKVLFIAVVVLNEEQANDIIPLLIQYGADPSDNCVQQCTAAVFARRFKKDYTARVLEAAIAATAVTGITTATGSINIQQ